VAIGNMTMTVLNIDEHYSTLNHEVQQKKKHVKQGTVTSNQLVIINNMQQQGKRRFLFGPLWSCI
jgi:hypothetical protein